jgi:hypothetical protein
MASRIGRSKVGTPKFRVAAFLRDADPQFDSDSAKNELKALLARLSSQSREALYAKAASNAVSILKRRLCSASPVQLNSKDLSKEMGSPSGLAAIRRESKKLLNRIEHRSPAVKAVCSYHPGRTATSSSFGKAFCGQCTAGIATAVAQVDVHVVPKGCFVAYKGGDTWEPLSGTGCAHWVAHQKGWSGGGTIRCLDEKKVRVPELVESLMTIARADVTVGDIWVQADKGHCGLVISVKAGSPNTITIRHDSSQQHGVVENDFDSFFGGRGSFKR